MYRRLLLGLLCLLSALAHAQNNLSTRYPIVFSHHWSATAEEAFKGDQWDGEGFEKWGIKQALEAQGAIVYQPNKIRFGSHFVRGELLYKKCAGNELFEMRCQGPNPQPIDGVMLAMQDYCSDTSKRGAEYTDYADCIDNVKINLICHSQGCPDSRYMISAITNELSGKAMSEHVASWTSVAGANNGTVFADIGLGLVADCSIPECSASGVDAALELLGFLQDGVWVKNGYQSIVSLSRKFMTETMDMSCDPDNESCLPSFNQAFPNDPDIYYQTYSGYIDWMHSCYTSYTIPRALVWLFEGINDGFISLESQQFLTAGPGPNQPPTHIKYHEIVYGESKTWWADHPGISHMGFSNNVVPGLPGVDCEGFGNDEDAYHFSRVALFERIVSRLVSQGF